VDDGKCPDTGDVCRPNVCTVGTGCQQIDITKRRELLSNGDFDSGNVDWVEMSLSYGQVIYSYDYVPTLRPHTPSYIAWLGGGQGLLDESNALSQATTVPSGTVRLDLSFFFQIWSQDLPDSTNHMTVSLRPVEADPSEGELVTFYNQDVTLIWTRFHATVDATAWAGSDIVLGFGGTGIGGYTHFFVDSVSLVATVCE
jgi:hypothetical protein